MSSPGAAPPVTPSINVTSLPLPAPSTPLPLPSTMAAAPAVAVQPKPAIADVLETIQMLNETAWNKAFAPLLPGQTISDRFPNTADGAEMLRKIVALYRRKKGERVQFLNSDGEWQLKTHPKNDRVQDQVVNDYVESILDSGFIEGVRSAAWAMYSPSIEDLPDTTGKVTNGISMENGIGTQPFLMLSFDKLSRAIYHAYTYCKTDPRYHNVLRTVQDGIDMDLFDYRTPDDISVWLIAWSNYFHGGLWIYVGKPKKK